MPAAIGLECFPRFLVYRRSYRLQRHPCGMPADVGWRWIGRAVASRLLMRIGGGTVLWVPPATTSGHSAMNVRGWCSQCRLQMRGVLRGTAFDLPPPHLLAVMGRDVKEPRGAQPLYRHFRPPSTVKNGNFANFFLGAYCTHRAAFWHLPTIRLLQRLGVALGRLRGLGLLPGLALPLLLPL